MLDPMKLSPQERAKLREHVKDMGRRFYSDDEFKTDVTGEVTRLKKELKEVKQESIMPHMVVFGFKDKDTGKYPAYFFAFANFPDNDRHEIFRKIGKKFALEIKKTPHHILFVSEAWTKNFTSKEQSDKFYESKKRVSDFEDKIEVVVIAGLTVDGRELSTFTKILRDENNCIVLEEAEPEYSYKAENYLLRNFMVGYGEGLREVQATQN